jgi:hypothetical protein
MNDGLLVGEGLEKILLNLEVEYGCLNPNSCHAVKPTNIAYNGQCHLHYLWHMKNHINQEHDY